MATSADTAERWEDKALSKLRLMLRNKHQVAHEPFPFPHSQMMRARKIRNPTLIRRRGRLAIGRVHTGKEPFRHASPTKFGALGGHDETHEVHATLNAAVDPSRTCSRISRMRMETKIRNSRPLREACQNNALGHGRSTAAASGSRCLYPAINLGDPVPVTPLG